MALPMKVFNHGLHIVLDVLTCGLWLPIHLIMWLCAPTVPVGWGGGVAAAAANTTVVMAAPPYPVVQQDSYRPVMHHPQPQAAQQPSTPPAWAIDAARERLPRDAPWEAVSSVAWEIANETPAAPAAPPTWPILPVTAEPHAPELEPRQNPNA